MKYYEIKVQLKGITKPPVWRKLRILSNTTFEDLHYIIQTAMGWENCHLHQFIIGERREDYIFIKSKEDIEMVGEIWGGQMLDEEEVAVSQFLKNPKDKLVYEYDFGDGWVHEVALEKIVDSDEKLPCPFLIGAKGACPPEDCGGVGGYEYLKDVFANSKKKEYKQSFKELSDWLGTKTWDAEAVDTEWIAELLEDWDDEGDSEFEESLDEMINSIVATRTNANKILVNLSNHPKDSWSKEQLKAAKKQFGDVVDIPFPNIAPDLDKEGIIELLIEYSKKVMEHNPMAVHVMGEMVFTAAFVAGMQNFGVPCYASTSERNVIMTKDGKKEVTFTFVQFREYL